jgi:hypothetical protein
MVEDMLFLYTVHILYCTSTVTHVQIDSIRTESIEGFL